MAKQVLKSAPRDWHATYPTDSCVAFHTADRVYEIVGVRCLQGRRVTGRAFILWTGHGPYVGFKFLRLADDDLTLKVRDARLPIEVEHRGNVMRASQPQDTYGAIYGLTA